jgi:hypothetical protein
MQVVAISRCAIFASGGRRLLPGPGRRWTCVHAVQRAVKTVRDSRRRAIRDDYSRRGRAGDPERGLRHPHKRAIRVTDTIGASGEIEAHQAPPEGMVGATSPLSGVPKHPVSLSFNLWVSV